MKLKNTSILCLIVASSLLLSACGKKKSTTPPDQPSPTPKMVEMSPEQKPYISLIPRHDGYELKLKISNIPDSIVGIEYELIYLATDGTIEIEKGIGDTVKVSGVTIEKDLLLGTASCTTTCKYKYDEGVVGGTLSLIFINNQGQMSTHETPFILTSSAQINTGKNLAVNDLVINATAGKGQFFILLENYGTPNSSTQATQIYSVFASGNGSGQIESIVPASIIKENHKTLSGDYLLK